MEVGALGRLWKPGARQNVWLPLRFAIVVGALLLAATPLAAEEACPKYRSGCVPLTSFKCETITRSSFIHRVCYAEAKRYMIIWFKDKKGNVREPPYHYCEIGPDVMAEFQAAPSMGRYFNERITGTPNKRGPFDCRNHPIPAI